MGFSTSGAMAVLFVGLLVAVGIAYPVLETAHDRRASAIDDRDERALDIRNTGVAIDEIETVDEEIVLIRVENTGTTTLSVDETDLLINGDYIERSEYETEVNEEDRDLWQPGETLEVFDLEDGDGNRVKIVTENGISVAEEVEQ